LSVMGPPDDMEIAEKRIRRIGSKEFPETFEKGVRNKRQPSRGPNPSQRLTY
jgi:hypothetical protein